MYVVRLYTGPEPEPSYALGGGGVICRLRRRIRIRWERYLLDYPSLIAVERLRPLTLAGKYVSGGL